MTDAAALTPITTSKTGRFQTPQVWLLGSRHQCADKSIRWSDPLPNLSDPDIIIVDLTTLTKKVLARMDKEKLMQMQQSITDKYHSRGVIIAITQPSFNITEAGSTYSNYTVLPIELETKNVPEGKRIMWGRHPIFQAYRGNVAHFSFHLGWNKSRLSRPRLAMRKHIEPYLLPWQEVSDRSQNQLGGIVTISEWDRTGWRESVAEVGRLVLLPPPTKPIQDAIGSILSFYGKTTPSTDSPPVWATELLLSPVVPLDKQITSHRKDANRLQEKIGQLLAQRDAILAHRRLLYSNGSTLEDAVIQAFETLGFDDIKHMGGADEEDAIFEMGRGTRYSHGIVEIKGSNRGAKLGHILQCGRWADQRSKSTGRSPKGIIVSNQHCSKDYPGSSAIRVHFEPNQLEYASMKDICIIPSCVLFEAVMRVLGGEAPDRAEIAAKIADCRGVLTDVL